MRLLKTIFVKPHGLFLRSILKEQDLSYEDIKGFLKTINEDLEILLSQMNHVNKMIQSHKSNRTANAKWYECQITLTHLIDCMIQVLPVIQAALNDCINRQTLDDSDRKSVSRKPVKLSPLRVDPKKIIQKMEQIINKTSVKRESQLDILNNAADLFSSMILICNRWLKGMLTAEFGLKS